MCAETINETINVCKYVGSARKSSNVEGDVILQDIKPDILSIVRVTRDLCVTQKKVEDGKIKLTGYIDVSIIYVADDNTNSQKGVNSKIDFKHVSISADRTSIFVHSSSNSVFISIFSFATCFS